MILIDRRLLENFDWKLLLFTLILIFVGILNIYSATFNIKSSDFPIYQKQLIWGIIGAFLILATLLIDYHFFERFAYHIYIISLLLLFLVFIIGKTTSGAQRWLILGPISIQPSEIMKLSLILVIARYFEKYWFEDGFRLRDLTVPFILTLIPFALIIKQPDMGTAGIIFIISFSILLFAKIKIKSLFIFICFVFLNIPIFWFLLKDYQRMRILTFLNSNQDPLGYGYHILQSKIAVGSGKLIGKGFLKGTQTQLRFLPEQHTDFAFSVLAEEWGFIGFIILIFLFLVLLIRGLNIANQAKDRFGAILAYGIIVMIFWQIIINIGMVTGIFPIVGIPLPFISYGGSSLLTTMIGIGIILNIGMRGKIF